MTKPQKILVEYKNGLWFVTTINYVFKNKDINRTQATIRKSMEEIIKREKDNGSN